MIFLEEKQTGWESTGSVRFIMRWCLQLDGRWTVRTEDAEAESCLADKRKQRSPASKHWSGLMSELCSWLDNTTKTKSWTCCVRLIRIEAAHKTISDHEQWKSSKSLYFCFPQLNLENSHNPNFDYYSALVADRHHCLFYHCVLSTVVSLKHYKPHLYLLHIKITSSETETFAVYLLFGFFQCILPLF